jgi:SAM-dependent methyltransferase
VSPPPRSYDPREGDADVAGELDRLELQAELAWPQEHRLLGELGIPADATLLEVGCGPGSVLRRLATLVPTGRVVGVEPDPELATAARAAVPGADILAGTAERLPLPDAAVDVAVIRFVLQHLEDPLAAVQELARVVRPGGVVVAIEVDGGLWGLAEPSFDVARAVQAKVWASQADRGGGDRMIGRRLHRLLAAAGLEHPQLHLYAYHSDDLGLDAFDAHLHPARLAPRLADATITPADYGAAHAAYARFRADPDAFVLLVGFLAAATVPRAAD